MNPYVMLGTRIGTPEAASLSARLAAWHDAMVAHERALRGGGTSVGCDDECPHVEARALWTEALASYGARAHELAFLRSRAAGYAHLASHATPAADAQAAGDRAPRPLRRSRMPTHDSSSRSLAADSIG